MSKDDAEANYRAQAGKAYLEQRSGAASDHVQALRASLFTDVAGCDNRVLDFGCGTGGVVSRLAAASRTGVEIGSEAAAVARAKGIRVVESLEELESHSIDVVISFHAIEHTENPADILRQIRRVVRPGGKVRLIVPGESPHDPRQSSWRHNDDMHLYTWTPLIFGNLAVIAGYSEISTAIAPMPTGSRAVKLVSACPPLKRILHHRIADRLNAWNVILNARVPATNG
ncbi:bifunctional 2-polyprenyl-6-hydroxyphenol methylase/3-demethylubiquinol 3-O-methyltransferase UbiG [Parafrankia sp. BMG5.11]|uniref:class I SAM-dependent methyltransferase n=1 Tax=Parafrankia sp. BMG5.11 TaxID=222540 RepID=UPI00103B6051|nr:class I SAM-dependent methyltransferase [Parafrankia sp. BMG5.11]TCJ40214.1 class I SAM-dependent methyltransferase [Parafrankia sp. BMG5.11]